MKQEPIDEVEKLFHIPDEILSGLKESSSYIDNRYEKAMIGKNGESIAIKENGDIGIASSINSQYKLTKSGYATEVSIQSNTITNRKELEIDELIINKHKLNPAIYELSDMRKTNINQSSAIGNLTMFSTVLVKCWEPSIKKWVLIRRLARVPVFSQITNLSKVPDNLSIDTDIADSILSMSKGGGKNV